MAELRVAGAAEGAAVTDRSIERDMAPDASLRTGADATSRAARKASRARLNSEQSKALAGGAIATLVGGACWGLSGTCASFLFEGYSLNPVWLLCIRQFFAGLLFVTYSLARDRERFLTLWKTREHRRILLAYALFGLYANQLCYLIAIDLTNSGTATVLQALQLVFIMAYVCLRAHRAPKLRETIGLVFALVGTFLIATGGNLGSLSIPPLGLAIGLINAFAAALLAIIPGKILKIYGSNNVTGSAMMLCGLVSCVFVQPWQNAPALDGAGIAALVIMVLVGSFLAFLLYMYGVQVIGAMRASLLGTIEPISATVTSAVFMHTAFSPTDLTGFALIIAMMFLTA